MNSLKLTDLDELVLTVRDVTSRSHIIEAVNAYRGGAYRAAIVATWIAIVYDIIAKIRELASQEDKQAEAFIRKLNNDVKRPNIIALSETEQSILETAYEKKDGGFKFLLSHEYTDLKRIKEDRNFCAHPAFVAEEELFQPSPELVRTHIVHAIVHLLQHRPIQGKSAISRILSDLKQPIFFKGDLKEVEIYLNDQYLKKAKESLVNNLVDILLKTLFNQDNDLIENEEVLIYALIAISHTHSKNYEERMKFKLPGIVETAKLVNLAVIFLLINEDQRCWNWLREPNQIRIKGILRSSIVEASQNSLRFQKVLKYKVFNAIFINELKPTLLEIFKKLDDSARIAVIIQNPTPLFAEDAVALYIKATSFKRAEYLGQNLLLPMASFFSNEQVVEILEKIQGNDQIYGANKTEDILSSFFDKTFKHFEYSRNAWKDLLEFLSDLNGYSDLFDKLKEYGIEPTT